MRQNSTCANRSAQVAGDLRRFCPERGRVRPDLEIPLAVGLVYLWIKEVPTAVSDAVLQGVTGFLQRLPARTSAYATLYGRKRQPIPN